MLMSSYEWSSVHVVDIRLFSISICQWRVWAFHFSWKSVQRKNGRGWRREKKGKERSNKFLWLCSRCWKLLAYFSILWWKLEFHSFSSSFEMDVKWMWVSTQNFSCLVCWAKSNVKWCTKKGRNFSRFSFHLLFELIEIEIKKMK